MQVLLKVLFFAGLFVVGSMLFGLLAYPFGFMVAATASTFFGALAATWVCMHRIEHAPAIDVGLRWRPFSLRNAMIGVLAGMVAALLVTVGPVLVGAARFVPDAARETDTSSILLASVMLLFGATGEEIAMRGYPFQLLVQRVGAPWALGITSILFGAMHLANNDATVLGIVNTMGFGVVLGYAMLRSGDLWFPSGMHYGWNWVLPMAGTPLSGFKLNLTGYRLEWNVPALWSGGGYGPEAGVLTCIVIVLLLVFIRRAPVIPDCPLLLKSTAEALCTIESDSSSSLPSPPESLPKN